MERADRYCNSILYLDHAASTPPAPEVVESMLPWLTDMHANPHSSHRHGQYAAAAVEQARGDVADLICAKPSEIIFTSGATESNNLILQGLLAHDAPGCLLAIAGIEHKSLLEPARYLSRLGVNVKTLGADSYGRISSEEIGKVLCDSVASLKLIAIGHGNNEIGTVQPLRSFGELTQCTDAFLHIDASQTVGKLQIDVRESAIDSMSFSSHKLRGPGGIGALFVTGALRHKLSPIMHGGGQEAGLRPGTVPVFLAVGFGAAAKLARRQMQKSAKHLSQLANALLANLEGLGLKYRLLGDPVDRLPGVVSIFIPEIDASDLLDSIASELSASTGSACAAGELRASHVLRAIGLTEAESRQVVRISFGCENALDDAANAANIIRRGVERLLVR